MTSQLPAAKKHTKNKAAMTSLSDDFIKHPAMFSDLPLLRKDCSNLTPNPGFPDNLIFSP